MEKPLNQRISSIDILKGIVLLFMALDHSRDYFHTEVFLYDPLDPEMTNWPIYMTRFITNFCAPAFSLLAGTSAFFVGRKKSKAELSGFLFKRGLWLIFIQMTIINFAWFFDPTFKWIELDVIASLGISMIVLAGLIHGSRPFILAFSLVLIFGHNLFDHVNLSDNLFWSILHEPGSFPINDHFAFNIWYPLIPWIGVMSLGYWIGKYYDKSYESAKRKRHFISIGLSSIALFILLRGFNIYGNPSSWESQDTFSKTLMVILDVNKYPPSLAFLLMTLGPVFLFLAYSEKLRGKFADFLMVYGRVPFLFYIIHLYVIHIIAMIAVEITWTGWETMILKEWVTEAEALKGYGFSLPIVYLLWIGVILILYPICKKFGDYKMAHKEKTWLSYF